MKEKSNKKYIKKSLIFFDNVKIKLIILMFIFICMAAIGFLMPIVEARIITSITSSVFNEVFLFACGYLLLTLFNSLLSYISTVFWQNKIKSKILSSVRKYLIDSTLQLQLVNFDKYSTGYFQERLKEDPETIASEISSIQSSLMECINRVGIVIYVMIINWILGLVYLGGVLLVTIINYHAEEVSKQKNKMVKKSEEESNSLLNELIRGIRDIKLLNFQKSIKTHVLKKLNDNYERSKDKEIYDKRNNEIVWIVLAITVFLVLILGIKFIELGLLSAANLIILYLYYGQVFSLMSNFIYLRSCIKNYELSIERIFELDNYNIHPKDNFGKIKIENLKGKIEFDNVSFGYTKNKNVLNELTFKINPKQTVAIVGSSGSGKTTIFNLLTKGYLINSGILKIDDIDINELDEETLRNNISIITQNPYIFNMSIKDNLKLVNPNATQKEIDKVCKDACFYDYVMSLPEKFDTVIGEGGVNLSGGQKQRLAIARALLKDSKILLFDEATSALDNITQQEIQESINNLSENYTIIIVAHRLSTIINCNPIFILDKGKIIDSGTHKELIQRNKQYKKLYEIELEK